MKFKRAENCGPVPYPDQSGRMLTDEIVEGKGWADLVHLGFVVPVDSKPGKRLPDPSKKAKPAARARAPKGKKVQAGDSSESMAKNAILSANESPGDVDVADDRNRANGVDPASPGSADAEDSSE